MNLIIVEALVVLGAIVGLLVILDNPRGFSMLLCKVLKGSARVTYKTVTVSYTLYRRIRDR